VFVVDTNVLVYAADAESPFHPKCRAFLEEARKDPSAWYLTWAICYEFLRVVTHPRVFRRPWTASQAWAFLAALVASPSVGFLAHTDRHAAVAAQVISELPLVAGNQMHDAHTAILMREHGIKTIYTRDTDFHRFPFLEPRDPTA
jgi:toxin-antitoxin system PIN domain toxin